MEPEILVCEFLASDLKAWHSENFLALRFLIPSLNRTLATGWISLNVEACCLLLSISFLFKYFTAFA